MKSILVVEDEKPLSDLIQKILSELEFDVICISEGFRAEHYLEIHVPDLVLLDVYLPGYNGLKLLEHIDFDRTSVIVFTGIDIEKSWAHIPGLEHVLILEKPVRLERLVKIIHSKLHNFSNS